MSLLEETGLYVSKASHTHQQVSPAIREGLRDAATTLVRKSGESVALSLTGLITSTGTEDILRDATYASKKSGAEFWEQCLGESFLRAIAEAPVAKTKEQYGGMYSLFVVLAAMEKQAERLQTGLRQVNAAIKETRSKKDMRGYDMMLWSRPIPMREYRRMPSWAQRLIGEDDKWSKRAQLRLLRRVAEAIRNLVSVFDLMKSLADAHTKHTQTKACCFTEFMEFHARLMGAMCELANLAIMFDHAGMPVLSSNVVELLRGRYDERRWSRDR
ncbi:hypothetical protein LTR17_017322 [Elasticomyces elasticus]|nr:hypothetical protein LTR17_017322 [Elasticomyces elasticus]